MPGAGGKNWNAKVILHKAESTEGTDSSPVVGTDALRVLNFQPTFMDADRKIRNIEKAYFGANPSLLANFKRGATFDMEIAGGGVGAGTTIPPWMKMLPICGFGAPVVGASSVTISPITASIPSSSDWWYIDDLLMKANGTRGSVGFTFQDDEIPIFSFNVLGRPPTALASQAVPGAATLTGYTEPLIASTEVSTFTWDSYAVPLRSWTMSDGAQLELRSLINPQDKINYINREWSGQIVFEVPDLTVKDYFAAIRPGTLTVATAVHGATPGNIVTISCPKLQITGNVTFAEEQGKLMATAPVTANPNTGNDEITFVSS